MPPPPPPTGPTTTRLVKVVTRRASYRSSFSQLDGQDNSLDDSDCSATVADEDDPLTATSASLQSPPPQPPPTNAAEVKAAVGVKEVSAVNTPDRHPRPLERAREKRRERLAQEESQRNRDLFKSVLDEDSASRCELEPEGACLVCEKVVAECDWDKRCWDENIAICKRCANTSISDFDPSFLQTLSGKVAARPESQ